MIYGWPEHARGQRFGLVRAKPFDSRSFNGFSLTTLRVLPLTTLSPNGLSEPKSATTTRSLTTLRPSGRASKTTESPQQPLTHFLPTQRDKTNTKRS